MPFQGGRDLYRAYFEIAAGAGLDAELLTVGRFESLVDDLERFLDRAGVALADGACERLRMRGPVNASDHRPYRDHYDDELRDLVGDSCRPLIDRFGYSS